MSSSTPTERPDGRRDRAPLGAVLAAGLGTRLRPLTDRLAKPTLPFLNRPLMAYGMDALLRAGVRRIGINAFHRPDTVAQCARDWQSSHLEDEVEIALAVETVLMGTGGGVRGIWERLGRPRRTLIVVNGDAVTDVDLTPHLQRHQESGAAATLLVARNGEGRVFVDERTAAVVQLPGPSGPVRVAPGGAEVSFTGLSILEPEAVLELPTEPGCLLRQGLAGRLLADARVRASPSDGLHLDVGTPQRYWSATRSALDRLGTALSDPPLDLPPGTVIHPPVLLDRSTVVAGAAELGPYLVTGGGTRVAAGTRAAFGVAFRTRLSGEFRERLRVGDTELVLP